METIIEWIFGNEKRFVIVWLIDLFLVLFGGIILPIIGCLIYSMSLISYEVNVTLCLIAVIVDLVGLVVSLFFSIGKIIYDNHDYNNNVHIRK